MAEAIQASFTLEHIFKICSDRHQPGDSGIGHVVSPSTYTETWNAFYKWIKTQLDQGRTVSVPSFANISARQADEKESFVYTQLTPQFLETYGLGFRTELPDIKQPTIRLNLNVMARLAENLDPQIAGVALSRVIGIIGEILASYENVEVNLAQFGRLNTQNKEVTFSPALKSKGNKFQAKQTVKTLLDAQQGAKHLFNTQRADEYPDKNLIDNNTQSQKTMIYNTPNVKDGKGNGLSPVRKVQDPYYSGKSKLAGHSTSFLSPSKKNIRPEVLQEMLGAGSDPLAKEQEFSHLISRPKDLMNTKFVKPPNAKVRFPPVIDAFARTLAAPISHTKFSLSVTGRIASNYTQSTKYLQVDMDAKVIKSIKPKESKIQLSANSEFLEEPASEDEELVYYLRPYDRTAEIEKRVKARVTSYNRYRQYVLSEIPIESIAPIRQYWINDILDLIPAEYPYLDRTTVENLIDRMLNEINKDYYDSGRKCILDYVLKEEDEKHRLGIMQILDEPLDYGENIYAGLEPDETWKETVGVAKSEVSDKLVIWSEATLQFKELWAEYENRLFVTLPGKEDKPLYIDDFVKLQNKTLFDAKNALVTTWMKNVQDIYKTEINQMNKKQAYVFFEANATLMSNQLRKLITESVLKYRDFFKRFQKLEEEHKSPQEVIEEEKDHTKTLEDVFLAVRMIFHENTVIFANSLPEIRQELLRIIENIVNVSDKFSRAEVNIARNDKTQLWPMTLEDEVIQNVFVEVDDIINSNCNAAAKVTEVFDKYIFLLTEEEHVQQFILREPTRAEYTAEIKKYKETFEAVNQEIPFYIHMPMIMVDCTDVKKELLRTCEKLIDDLVGAISKLVNEKNGFMNRNISNLKESIREQAETVETLVRLEENIERIRSVEKGQIEKDFRDLTLWLLMLYDTHHKVSEEDIAKIYRTSLEVKSIDAYVEENQNRIRDERTLLENKLTKQRSEFIQSLESMAQEIEGINDYATPMVEKQANERIDTLKSQLATYENIKEEINHKEELLGIPLFSFDKLADVVAALKPYEDLWRLVKDFKSSYQQWTREKTILKLDPEAVEKETKQMLTTATKMTMIFTKTNPKTVATGILKEIREFSQHAPLVSCLCNPGLKERHWNEIYELGLQKIPGKDLYFKAVIDSELFKQLPKIIDISDAAGKEYTNEKILTKMADDWQPLVCELKPWKDTGTFAISGATVDEAQQILDDQIVKTQTMKGSPFARIFEDRINEWENWLKYTQDVFDYWVKVQSVWLYLEPVFSSEDIMKQMPVEGAKFKEVDNSWRIIMGKINQNPKVTEVMKNKKLLDSFKEAYDALEVVQKGLNTYLEGKRTAFPRFYFLSSDELLEILSETKDPTRVQPHLKKCFEGINKLRFDETKKIHSMYSSEGEEVPFVNIVDAMAARGAVEQWLIQVEDMMITSVKDSIEKSFEAYPKMNRNDWVLNRVGQSVLTISMTYWTYEVEAALKERGLAGLTEYLAQLEQQIREVVRLVKGDISVLNRCTLEALIVLDVHNKDVVKNLVDQKISEITDFAWFSQLRYYWENSDTVVRIINAQVQYNYEYLGNSPRLVITPLTDRCYRTLCGAIHLNYGGAPEGPAGTGKTETVKDLAKALARQCVVFNCSDGLDYKAMGKFFKGLASSGAWSCFDEFNRIDLEVLSVIAQQILTIQIAVGQKKSSFDFEGSHIKLKLTANCFITMNPGYAGRSELPDNLKALFRSVAMMVPDYALIAEISLYSFGFEKARTLAQKIVTTYKLCSEQLSSQDHYDYGMRAVKSVLTAAGNLLRKYPNDDEYILVLRAINDVNLAKFLSFDLPLFKGITSDLFPGTELPPIDYSALLTAIDNQIKIMKLQKTEYFVEKIIQLYEMIRVRHGLMVVGWPFAGKTSILRVLAASLGELCEKNQMDEKKVQVTYLNPKSISMKQLYGYNDEATQEWTDGVLAVKYKAFAKSESEDRKWLVFDGPIDAVWIENMNTVLDDNKKLCLNSGEIIAMSKSMNMIFEPMDLLAASPATVSRCGMVYLEPANMGWKPIFDSWKENELPKTFNQDEIFRITDLFDQYIDPLLKYHRKSCQETSPTQDQNLVRACMRIYAALLKPFNDEVYFNSIELKSRLNILDNYFIFSLIWSLGGSLTSQSRRNFDVNLKKIANGGEGGKKKLTLPDKQLYEYIYQINKGQEEGTWTLWTDLINPNETIPAKMQPQEIIVKTTDTVRYSYLVDLFIRNEIDGLFCGPTGTGKSVYIKNVLNQLPKDKYLVIDVAFSAQTSSNQTQDIVDGNLTRRKKGYFGPPIGKRTILFVDDLNMPSKEKYGAQPPIEILRQLLDQGGWYDLKDKERPFCHILDYNFISAMGPPGGGRTFITPRITRHLNLVSFTNFDDDTLKRIFNNILHWYFGNNNFPADIVKLENKLVTGTLEIYQKAMEDLRPTPMKSHYLFNLRDFSKVILGICMSDKDRVNEVDQMIRLWMHEVWRVFADRLVSDEDKLILFEHIKEIVRKTFGVKFDTVFARLDNNGDGKVDRLDEIRGLMFTDLMSANQIKQYYEEVTDFSKLQESVESSLGNYNMLSDKPMDLVMFSFAVEHLLIIGRILKQPGGNALLIGVGGSGRQSLTRLAAHIKEYHVKQIEITKNYGKTEWRDDLKLLLKNAGGKGNPTVFLFTDSQIKEESFVEDINTLLNSGEVPNLFPADEKAEIMEMVRASARSEGKAPDGTPSQLFGYFVERVKKMLHIVMCFSPIGEALRTRIRMFPSLVNCCTIDWFSAWPGDALYSVAKKFMKEIDMDATVRESCEEMLQFFHISTIDWAQEFYKSLKRKYYVTPTSYLEMIITFKTLLAEKRKEVLANKNKYENGYDKIIVTESLVGEMQLSLTDLKPKLEKASKDTEIKLKEVAVQKGEADKVKAVVSAEEEIASKAAGEANAIKRECEGELEKALPLLREAESALKVLTKKDFDEMKAYKIPPNPVKLTCQAVLLLTKRVKVERKPNKSGEMEFQWWEASVKMLGDSTLMDYLLNFKESIDDVEEATIKKLGDFLNENKDSLTKDAVKSSSTAAAGLIMWVNGIYNFYFVNKEIKPKKEKLAKAEAEAKALMDQLAIKQKLLKDVNDKVDKLTRELNDTERNKAKLEAQYNDVLKKLDRATKLIDSLGSEKGRWKELGGILAQVYTDLTGDILVSAGMIAYLGAFTSAFRSQISQQWVSKCKEGKIPSSEVYSLQQVLGDPVKIRDWNISGLPSDAFSIENGIIISKSRRWPLCIDPQGQANKWIKNMGKDQKIAITKLSDPDLLRTLENAIQFGRTVLIENVYEDLDPSLAPILLKQTFQKGNTIYIKIGDQTIEYNPAFRLYITTKLRNPHYLPEISTQVTLLNFMITLEGLNDQLLGIVVKKERPELENEKERLIIEGANNKRRLFELEEEILKVLSEAKNILEDEKGVEILTASKITSNEIKEKQAIAEQTEKDIDAARTLYRPVSNEASCLFFAITDLANIDPMYQYSLTYFIDLFSQAISKSEQSSDLEVRLGNLKSYFLYSLYSNICRSLFEKDKLLFSFLLSTRLKDFRKELNSEQYRFLLTGGVSLGEQLPEKPQVVWISDKAWAEIFRMSNLEHFGGLHKNIKENLDAWKIIYDSPNPHKETMPEPQQSGLSKFEKLLVLRALRPDKMIPAVQDFVADDLGAKFIDPPAFDLEKVYKDSSSTTPLIFVLSPGSDPFANLYKFAEKMNKQVVAISLGQGQGEKASMAIKEGCETGGWVVLQNCHLAIRWMPTLEKICEELNPDPKFTHPEFRLWLTSYPSPDFPVAILQSGVKMTNEPPKGLRANLLRSYLTDPLSDANFFESCRRGPEFKKLLYGLCFFHAVIQERRKFGPLGWNIPYEFTDSDLRISARQLHMFLHDDSELVPFDALKYLTAECNYGGRVTDDKDRRLITTLLDDFYCQGIVSDENYTFSAIQFYKAPRTNDYNETLEFIKGFPLIVEPEVFGLHANADITKDIGETNLLLDSLLLCQSESGSSESSSQEDVLKKLIDSIRSDFPGPFDIQKASEKYPVSYKESMNTVLTQELGRFNILIKIVLSSLENIRDAMDGKILLSAQLERASKSLYDGKVPEMWMEKSYPSLKPLGGYIKDLKERLDFFRKWIEEGQPNVYWLSGFFFTQSFLTGVLQNFARKYTIAIDLVKFDFEFVKDVPQEKPANGALVYGLFIEGSKWNYDTMELDESDPKKLFVECPTILLKPTEAPSDYQNYNCPVYKTSARRGTLSTTGHSTNFVMFIRLPTSQPESHWIKRGVALLTQLDD